jgi:hypothetical protein
MNKSKLIEALNRWIRQRPGLEFCNYGDWGAYRSEMRSITKDRHQAEALLLYVAARDSITAESIVKASRSAFSGRLEIEVLNDGEDFSIGYCVGQYFPTEYRKAVCSVLAAAVWNYLREQMPAAQGTVRESIGSGPFEQVIEVDNIQGMSPGRWMRQQAKRELGRSIASRWLS